MSSAACIYMLCISKAKIRLVHQRSCAEGRIALPLAPVVMGNVPQLGIDERKHGIECSLIAPVQVCQKAGDSSPCGIVGLRDAGQGRGECRTE